MLAFRRNLPSEPPRRFDLKHFPENTGTDEWTRKCENDTMQSCSSLQQQRAVFKLHVNVLKAAGEGAKSTTDPFLLGLYLARAINRLGLKPWIKKKKEGMNHF